MRRHAWSLAASACLLMAIAFLYVAFDSLLFTDVLRYRAAIVATNFALGVGLWVLGIRLTRRGCTRHL